ncbi:hypothetical protein EIN_166120 [Entamoeba invadens IP1]|uniref:Uncharacterized protein n=1 Tax=Entamoeba invadens IP1 TaxID=370355 RepID=A0A0A1UBS4_ENTIV|nr:hypothetical protein EIN_166120 [Entamoeba invadens IP1]ELP92607.1 hypothetical protein EIN_166120 [Entamoeba invadens IP1]|eukprot:XP_004259378.1 hypothetical protein EIN_166120 [Entamoeba invadens IP1]
MCDHILYPNSKEKLNTNLVQLNSECTCKIKEDEIVVFADLYQTRRFLDIIPKLKEPSKSEKIRRIEKAPKEDKFKYEEWRVEQKKPKACVGMYRGETTKEIKHSSIDDVLNEDWIDSDSTDDCEDVELEGLESYLYKE